MTQEENYYRAVEFRFPEWIPIQVSLLPATWQTYREALEEIVLRHPLIFGQHQPGSKDFDELEGTYQKGKHTDEWGCVWENIAPGLDGQVVGHPLVDRAAVRSFEPPPVGTGLPHGFMFQRLYYLRGFENLMVDFAERPPELQILIDKVLDHNLAELELILAEKPRTLYFGDDLGNQQRLPIRPEAFREYLKPCYARIYGACRAAGTHVYMHSDGHILEIIGDLIECGVMILNPQVRANTLDGLAATCKGKVCVNLDLDRQMFPFVPSEEIDTHIREAVTKLGAPEGGLMLLAECGPDVPLRNIEAICTALEKYRTYSASQRS